MNVIAARKDTGHLELSTLWLTLLPVGVELALLARNAGSNTGTSPAERPSRTAHASDVGLRATPRAPARTNIDEHERSGAQAAAEDVDQDSSGDIDSGRVAAVLRHVASVRDRESPAGGTFADLMEAPELIANGATRLVRTMPGAPPAPKAHALRVHQLTPFGRHLMSEIERTGMSVSEITRRVAHRCVDLSSAATLRSAVTGLVAGRLAVHPRELCGILQALPLSATARMTMLRGHAHDCLQTMPMKGHRSLIIAALVTVYALADSDDARFEALCNWADRIGPRAA